MILHFSRYLISMVKQLLNGLIQQVKKSSFFGCFKSVTVTSNQMNRIHSCVQTAEVNSRQLTLQHADNIPHNIASKSRLSMR